MGRVGVSSQRKTATTGMSAKGVKRGDMGRCPALQKNLSEVTNGMKPRYLHYNIWDLDTDLSANTSDWTLTADRTEKCICTDIAILAYYFCKFDLFALLNEITSQYLIKG